MEEEKKNTGKLKHGRIILVITICVNKRNASVERQKSFYLVLKLDMIFERHTYTIRAGKH